MVAMLPAIIYDRNITGIALKGPAGSSVTIYRDTVNGTLLATTPRGDQNTFNCSITLRQNENLVVVWNQVGTNVSATFFQEQALQSQISGTHLGTWSETRPDTITIPASVPIGPGQDGVIISGANIPPELQAQNISAAIIFQRGSYPNQGAGVPETKYWYLGISFNGIMAAGSVVDTKGVAGLVVKDSIVLPLNWIATTNVLYTNGYRANVNQILGDLLHTGIPYFYEFHRWKFDSVSADSNGWCAVTLQNSWTAGGVTGFYSGMRWLHSPDGYGTISGTVVAPVGVAQGQVIGNISGFPGNNRNSLPDKNHVYTTFTVPAPGKVVTVILDTSGNVSIDGSVNLPAAGDTVFLSNFMYPIRPLGGG